MNGKPSFRYHSSRRPVATIGLICLTALASLSGCEQIVPAPKLKMAYVNWADATAMTFLVKAVFEEEFGYRVETTMADAAPVFTSVADGGHDVFVDAWVPITHGEYIKRFQDRLVDLGPNYRGTQIGLVVPEYVDVKSIDDLNEEAATFDGTIVGIDSGAGIMAATEQAIDDYELDFRLLPSSEAAMAASLKEAIDGRRPIVVTGWKPHWMFARWQLRFLEDPRGAYPQQEDIHTVVRPGFETDFPGATEFLRRFELTAEQLNGLMAAMRDRDADPDAIAKKWLEDHPEIVERWLADLSVPKESKTD
jgi:glycine betaine/proline transport system substrate-binding protein